MSSLRARRPVARRPTGRWKMRFCNTMGLIRTLMLALQSRIKGEIPVDHPAVLWLIAHAGELHTRRQVGQDGRTPYERLVGKPCWGESLEF
eukprot:5251710-Alexandrium_andersonii.AAC.1